jgi:flagellar motor switch protein FliN/FliY
MDETENVEFENLEEGAAEQGAAEAPAAEEMSPDDIDAAVTTAAAEPETGGSSEPGSELVSGDRKRGSDSVAGLEAVYDIPVQISAVLGKSTMQVSQLLKLGRGAVVELDRKVGEAIDIYVNNRLVARGEVVVVNERLGVTMTEIIKAD